MCVCMRACLRACVFVCLCNGVMCIVGMCMSVNVRLCTQICVCLCIYKRVCVFCICTLEQ